MPRSAMRRWTPPRPRRPSLAALMNSAETASSFSNHHRASSASVANLGIFRLVIVPCPYCQVSLLVSFRWFERSYDARPFASHCDDDPENAPCIRLTDVSPSLFTIYIWVEPEVQRTGEKNLLGFFWCHIMFGDVADVVIVPIKLRLGH